MSGHELLIQELKKIYVGKCIENNKGFRMLVADITFELDFDNPELIFWDQFKDIISIVSLTHKLPEIT